MASSYCMVLLVLCSWCTVCSTGDKPLNFLVFGDWGMGNEQQKAVADQMEATSSAAESKFVVNVGDNFYVFTRDAQGNAQGGVKNLTDPLWQKYFEEMYSGYLKNIPFYSVLGNHDYMGNTSAQLMYHGLSPRWVMPDRNYTARLTVDSKGTTALFVFLDTSPFIESYYTDPEDPWMKEQLAHQDYQKQLAWLDEVLSQSSDHWKLVIGHHPILSHAGVFLPGQVTQSMALIQPVLLRHHVPAYICGHVHKLEYLQQDGVDYFISGAGATGKVYVDDSGMQQSVVWTSDDAGFMTVELNATQMISKYINTKGEVIYTVITKP